MEDKEKLFLDALFGVIVSLREEQHMSQNELAIKANLERSYISDIERGKRNPSIGVLLRISDAFEIPLSSLIIRTEFALKEGNELDNEKNWPDSFI